MRTYSIPPSQALSCSLSPGVKLSGARCPLRSSLLFRYFANSPPRAVFQSIWLVSLLQLHFSKLRSTVNNTNGQLSTPFCKRHSAYFLNSRMILVCFLVVSLFCLLLGSLICLLLGLLICSLAYSFSFQF